MMVNPANPTAIGYPEPVICLRAYPEQREALYAAHAPMTDEAMRWIDTSCLWLINGGDEKEDRCDSEQSAQCSRKGVHCKVSTCHLNYCSDQGHGDLLRPDQHAKSQWLLEH